MYLKTFVCRCSSCVRRVLQNHAAVFFLIFAGVVFWFFGVLFAPTLAGDALTGRRERAGRLALPRSRSGLGAQGFRRTTRVFEPLFYYVCCKTPCRPDPLGVMSGARFKHKNENDSSTRVSFCYD